MSPRLTLNVGVRYDLNTVIEEKNGRLANFDPATGIHQVGHGISAPYNGDHNNFAPRFGMSWDPGGKGKTVVRAGGGIIYEIPHLSLFLGQNGVNNASTAGINVIPTAPSTGIPGTNGNIAASSVNVPGGGVNGLNWSTAGPVFQTSIDCTATPCDILAVSKNLRTPYVINWNLNVQRALTSSTSLQVGYVGDHGVKLYGVRDINQVDPNSAAELDPACGHCEQAGRPLNSPYPYLEFINFLDNGYTSSYNSLQATLTQRTWKRMNFVLGYTFAHAIDDVSLNRGQQPQDSTRPGLERSNSDSDLRHRVTMALTYELPSRAGYGHLLEGWQLNSIVTIQGGLPWNLDDGFINGSDSSLTGEFSDRWNIVGNPGNIKPSLTGVPYFNFSDYDPATRGVALQPQSPQVCIDHADIGQLAPKSTAVPGGVGLGCYVENGTILVPPNVGTFGNISRNPFRGPRLDNWDFSIVKDTKLSERVSFQLRGEFFNVLNHPHFANPNTQGFVDPSDPSTFGFIFSTPDVAAANPVIGTGGPRNIQIGLKFRF